VIGTRTNNTNLYAVFRVPSGISVQSATIIKGKNAPVDNVETFARVQVIDCTFTIDHEDLVIQLEVHRSFK
jgi:hypothetical protein